MPNIDFWYSHSGFYKIVFMYIYSVLFSSLIFGISMSLQVLFESL
ncbi:unnamed protein product [Brassica rapa subsp. narinosa]